MDKIAQAPIDNVVSYKTNMNPSIIPIGPVIIHAAEKFNKPLDNF